MSTDEKELRIQIEHHRNQLKTITEQYQRNPNENLISLKCNLEELVQLLNDELTNIEKKKIVNQLNQSDNNQDDNENEETNDRLEFSVPYRFQNGQIEYHDAIITFADDDEHVKAFFIYPIESSMLTCPYFLQNNCHYGDTCKYSHGFHVSIDQLAPKLALDLSNENNLNQLKDKTIKYCLVEHEKPFKNTGQFLWSVGLLVDFKNCDQVLVRFLNDIEEWINPDRLIILNDLPSQKPNTTDDTPQPVCFTDNHQVSIRVHDQFGAWEKYTNGFGSKLLAKMGYEIGKGLGKQADGIINPIQPVIYPPGKSLDNCFFLKQELDKKKNQWKEVIKERKKLSKFENRLSKLSCNNKWKRNSIFQLLNTKLINSHQTQKKEQFVKKDYFKKMNKQTLNVAFFKLEKDLQKAQLELEKMENCFNDRINHTSSTSSSCHDKTILNDFHGRINKQRNLVSNLQQQYSTISKEIKTRIQRNKLTNF